MVMVIDDNGREGSREQERFQSLTESRRRPSRHHVVLQTVPSGGSTNRKARRPTLDRLTYGTNKRSWSVLTRDLREWLATSPFPPIPVSSFPFPWCLVFNSHSRPVIRIDSHSLPLPFPPDTTFITEWSNDKCSKCKHSTVFASKCHIVSYRWIIKMQNVQNAKAQLSQFQNLN